MQDHAVVLILFQPCAVVFLKSSMASASLSGLPGSQTFDGLASASGAAGFDLVLKTCPSCRLSTRFRI